MALAADLTDLQNTTVFYDKIERSIAKAVAQLKDNQPVDVAEILHTVKVGEREINRRVNRAAKTVDKLYPTLLSEDDLKTFEPAAGTDATELLNRAVYIHMLQTGALEAANHMLTECTLLDEGAAELGRKIIESNKVLSALQAGSLHPAKEWLGEHAAEIDPAAGKNLQFDLKRAEILLEYSANHDRSVAIAHARQQLGAFYKLREEDLFELSTAITVWDGTLDPPDTLGSQIMRKSLGSLESSLQKAMVRNIQLAPKSPLATAYLASVYCLPAYAQIVDLVHSGEVKWASDTQMPIEVPLSADLQFHRLFVCPISREETSKENPPVILPCGHVFSKDCASELPLFSRTGTEIKCPYCPRHFEASATRNVVFM